MEPVTKAQLVSNLISYDYSLTADCTGRGFDRQIYVNSTGMTTTVSSTGAANTIGSGPTNRMNPANNTSSIGDLTDVANHLQVIHNETT